MRECACLSFILSGVGCLFAGLAYAEFASMIPIAGSAYTYSYATLGEFVAWIAGWDLILEYLFGASTVAVRMVWLYGKFLRLRCNCSDVISNAPLAHDAVNGWFLTGAIINFPAVFIVLVMTALLVVGIKRICKYK